MFYEIIDQYRQRIRGPYWHPETADFVRRENEMRLSDKSTLNLGIAITNDEPDSPPSENDRIVAALKKLLARYPEVVLRHYPCTHLVCEVGDETNIGETLLEAVELAASELGKETK